MLKTLGLTSLLVMVAVGPGSVFVADADAKGAKPTKVGICHFEGHTADNPFGGDFVLGNQSTTGGHGVCETIFGGNAIFVGGNACAKGHGAADRRGRSCENPGS